jgi:hypothetical protein
MGHRLSAIQLLVHLPVVVSLRSVELSRLGVAVRRPGDEKLEWLMREYVKCMSFHQLS